MKCIVIDDDKIVRTLLEKYVSKTKFLEYKGAFSNPVEAINEVDMEEIDLIFVDIEMPEMSGLDFIKSLSNPPMFIVISAKEKYAIDAIDSDAIDYLLKPIEYPRFLKSVNKAKDFQLIREKKDDKGIFIKDGGSSFIRIRYDSIIWIEALENYVLIVSEEDKHTIHFTMKSLEMQLPKNKFARIHRSYIVNINKILSIEDNYVIINYHDKKKSFPVAKSFRESLLSKIKIISK
jgi:DNA-binding LytR/AlgR family response regulator